MIFLTLLKNISHFPSLSLTKVVFVIVTFSENFGHENFHCFDLTEKKSMSEMRRNALVFQQNCTHSLLIKICK